MLSRMSEASKKASKEAMAGPMVICDLCEKRVPENTTEPEVIHWSPYNTDGEKINLCSNKIGDCWTQFTEGKQVNKYCAD